MSVIVRKSSKGISQILDHLPPPVRQWILAIGVTIVKNEKLIESVKLLKLAKTSGAFAAGISVLVSIGFYSAEKGTAFAFAFVSALLLHEVGHVTAMWRKGLGGFWELLSSMRAVPFVGAFIQAPDWASREDEAFIGYGGPLFSTVGGFILLLLYFFIPPIVIASLSKVFLFFALGLLFSVFYDVIILRGMPIKRKRRQSSWGDVMEQFFSIPLVRRICAKLCFAGIAFLVWRYATDAPVGAPLLIYMTAFLSMAFASLNLVITIRPLDGGRVLQIVGSLFRYVGIAVLVALSVYLQESSIFLIWMIVLVGVRMNPILRFYSVIAMWMIMMISILLGNTSQTMMENIIDIFLGAWMFSIAYARRKEKWNPNGVGDRRREPREGIRRKDRRKEKASWFVRLKWLALYMALLFAVFKLGEMIIRIIPPDFKM